MWRTVFESRQQRTVGAVVAICALAAALAAVPAAAKGCPAWSKVKSWRGYVIVDFHHTVTEPDGAGGTTTVTLDRGTGDIHFPKLTPLRAGGHHGRIVEFRGKSKGGVMTVDDSYSDTGASASGTQTADDRPAGKATIGVPPFGCSYDVVAGFLVPTTSSGNWPPQPENDVGMLAQSPARPIPSNLHLEGSATVRWYFNGGGTPADGLFDTYAGLTGSSSSWERAFGNVSRDNGSAYATATITWHFAPH